MSLSTSVLCGMFGFCFVVLSNGRKMGCLVTMDLMHPFLWWWKAGEIEEMRQPSAFSWGPSLSPCSKTRNQEILERRNPR